MLQLGPSPLPAPCERAVLISVDGLRSDALLALPARELPGFARLAEGASTLNARTDPELTITLPNHTSMVTGRAVRGAAGHRWERNVEPDPAEDLHTEAGHYLASLFDVAHDRGLATALVSGKPKFRLYEQSYDAWRGAADTEGPDDGRDKLDRCVITTSASATTDALLAALRELGPRSLVFAHYATTDHVAHRDGWDVTPSSQYMQAVRLVDRELARLLEALTGDPLLACTTAVVLTTDHGGGAPFRSHDQPHMWVDYVIPFLVWTPAAAGQDGPRDLYELNRGRRAEPGLGRPRDAAGVLPPIRNGEAGNVVLGLLGLPCIPGSTLGASQDLRVR